MDILVEVCIYLCIMLGLIITIISFTEPKNVKKFQGKYVRKKCRGTEVKVEVNVTGLSYEETERIGHIIASGMFNNIYDLADSFVVVREKDREMFDNK